MTTGTADVSVLGERGRWGSIRTFALRVAETPATLVRSGLIILILVGIHAATAAASGVGAADSLRLVVNLPACRVDAIDGTDTARYGVSVGSRAHPTPTGTYEVDRVIWNPWWIPPPFPWAAGYAATPPGPDNPIGRVKLYFGGYLYLHGTPAEEQIGQPASHGCVRMAQADAVALARTIHRWATPAVPDSLLDALQADQRLTRSIAMDRPVPLLIEYRRVEVVDGRLEIHPDVYGLDPAVEAADLLQALVRAGVDIERIDARRLKAVVDRAGDGTVSVPVQSLTHR